MVILKLYDFNQVNFYFLVIVIKFTFSILTLKV